MIGVCKKLDGTESSRNKRERCMSQCKKGVTRHLTSRSRRVMDDLYFPSLTEKVLSLTVDNSHDGGGTVLTNLSVNGRRTKEGV